MFQTNVQRASGLAPRGMAMLSSPAMNENEMMKSGAVGRNGAPPDLGEAEFYAACAELLGTEHHWRDSRPRPRVDRLTGALYTPSTRATRWGGREPGNGRFPGFGLIRCFGHRVQVALKAPVRCTAVFASRREALEGLIALLPAARPPGASGANSPP